MLENEGQRKQSLKRGLIELEDELDIGNERKERLMVTKISLIKRIIIPDVKKKMWKRVNLRPTYTKGYTNFNKKKMSLKIQIQRYLITKKGFQINAKNEDLILKSVYIPPMKMYIMMKII